MKQQNFNLFIAVIIVIGFVFFWDAFIVSRYAPPKKESKPAVATNNNEAQISHPVPEKPSGTSTVEPPRKAHLGPDQIQKKVLENNVSRITFETQGARVLSWDLKEKNHWVQLVAANPESGKFPFESFSDLNFKVDSANNQKIVFSGVLPNGIKVVKTFLLEEGSRPSELTFSFTNPGKAEVNVDGSLDWAGGLFKKIEGAKKNSKADSQAQAEVRAVGFVDKARAWKPGAFFGKTKDEIVSGPFKWVAVDNEHFLAAFIPENNSLPAIRVFFNKTMPPSISIPVREKLGPRETKQVGFKVYVGPKRLDDLEKIGFDLKYAIDYGFLEKVLLASLNFFQKFTNNYGWSIILLTICVQILMLPLTRKSLQSSIKMKAIQPQIKKIQELYKKDPQRLHIETMNVYKKHGMKFMGMEGCLPLIIQMPIFFAIFKMLRSAYDLRGAEWILWIKDLSAADPYYVLPVLMGVGMFVQQKMTTVSVDPAQAKMMYIFPVVLTFMFSSMPSGLVIYWIVQSAATVVVQKFLTLHLSPQAPPKS